MMRNLERIYDRAFFEEWGRANERFVEAAERIAGRLFDQFSPRRIVDAGCGCGVYVDAFRRRGVEVVAIDGVACPPEYSFTFDRVDRDLTEPFENEWGPFDFALCLEVAEHIPEEFSGVFLDNLARLSDTLVLSAAPPNQGGTHHVNEQPKRYWVKKLAERGYRYNRKRTGEFLEESKRFPGPLAWMYHQISIYEKSDGPIELSRLPLTE